MLIFLYYLFGKNELGEVSTIIYKLGYVAGVSATLSPDGPTVASRAQRGSLLGPMCNVA